MEAASGAVAFGQAAKACVKLGHEIFQRYRAYKCSDDRIAELIIRTEATWIKTSAQLELLNSIRHELDPKLLSSFDACLARLVIKLSLARVEVEALTSQNNSDFSLDKISLLLRRSKKARYSIFEQHIKKTVEELTNWQTEFDPSWLFTIRLTSGKMDAALSAQSQSTPKASIFQDVRNIRAVLKDIKHDIGDGATVFKECSFISADVSKTTLPYSNLVVTKAANHQGNVILDTTSYPSVIDTNEIERQVENLARVLIHAEPSTLGLLRCFGVLRLPMDEDLIQQYQFIYSVPHDLQQPATLRHMLAETIVSLDEKFSLARSMARGVASVHAAGFVHKNIRPETVLNFRNNVTKMSSTFLVGFENFRGVSDGTSYTGDMVWSHNLYRHPQRQGRRPEFMYEMRHDIYSLGVCLLEIGLWESFVVQIEPPQVGSSLQISTELDMSNKRKSALEIKKKLITLASEKLPSVMGQVYSELVVSCLTCLDPHPANVFADEDVTDEDEIQVGMIFVEQVFMRLSSIHF